MDLLQLLESRRSIGPKHMTEPAPDDAALERALRAARTAPAHTSEGEDFPVRFVRIRSRDRLAELFLSRLPADADEERRRKAAGKARKGPGLLALVVRKFEDDRQDAETVATAGAALMNLLASLHADGWAAKTVSAPDFEDPQGLYDPAAERLLAFVLCGKPKEAPAPVERPKLTLTDW